MISSLKQKLVATLVAASLLMPSVAGAATARFHWWHTDLPGSCGNGQLVAEGLPFFGVNATPIPTYTVPGSTGSSQDGSRLLQALAPFDSVLLRTGANELSFAASTVNGGDPCTYSHEVVWLESETLPQARPLFDAWRVGTAFQGVAAVNLTLQEINPKLAQDLANLEAAIAASRQNLIDNASKIADLAGKLDTLQALEAELTALLDRPLDEITQADLDAILARYGSVVDAATRAALEQLLADLKKSLEDLRGELTRLLAEFAAQADAAADSATQAARATGWNPDDPANYQLGRGDPPTVTIPDVSPASDTFDAENDPYGSYADKVLAKLQADVIDNQVVNRGSFLVNVKSWRTNTKALQKALQQRAGVSQAETSAFLNAQNRVTAYVRGFINADDWYIDAYASPLLRSLVDGPLRQQWEEGADRLKTDLNLWPPAPPTELNRMLSEVMTGAIGGIQGMVLAGELLTDQLVIMGQIEMTAAKLVIGVTPVVGQALGFCELVTGKDFCIPGGRDLDITERLFSGVGSISMGGVFFRGAKNVTTQGRAAYMLAEAAELTETALVRGIRTSYVKIWRGLRGGIVPVGELSSFELKVGKAMTDDGRKLLSIGDNAVRKTLGMPIGSDVTKCADYLSIHPSGKFVVSEVKAVGPGATETGKAIKQLTNTVQGLAAKNLDSEVTALELVVPTGGQIGENYSVSALGTLVSGATNQEVKVLNRLKVFVKFVDP